MKKYFCVYENTSYHGHTLRDAWQECVDNEGDSSSNIDNCEFFEADEISVEMKIERKETVVKSAKGILPK